MRDAIQATRALERAERLEEIAAQMRQRNLTRGSGCASVARAIAARLKRASEGAALKKFSSTKSVET